MSVARVAPSNRLLYAALAVLMTVSIGIQVVRDRGWQAYAPPSGVMWIQSGPLAERLALSFDSLVSDVYWMRAVVYFGGQRRSEHATKNFDQLYPLLDLVTSLDPHFRVAYRFGSLFLGERFPGGAGRPDQAIKLLEKGLEQDPSRWEYAMDIGFVYYWWLNDFARAAEWFDRGGKIPGGAEWLAPLAAVTLAEGGNRESSRQLWNNLRDNTDQEWIKTTAEHRLAQLAAMDTIDQLNAISEQFTKSRGRPAANWGELVAAMRWRGVPLDSGGAPFSLDPATGRVGLANTSSLWPLPDETATRARRQ